MENGDEPKDPNVPATPEEPEADLSDYRKDLVDTLQLLNQSYDKLLVTLAGGALALSIAFLKDVIDMESAVGLGLLFQAWAAFIVSLAAVLGRILFGIEGHRKAIRQVDDETIDNERPGGLFSAFSRILHITSAITLLVGLILIARFSYLNVGDNDGERQTETPTQACAETDAPTEAVTPEGTGTDSGISRPADPEVGRDSAAEEKVVTCRAKRRGTL